MLLELTLIVHIRCYNLYLLYIYNFIAIENTHLRHVTVHYFSRIVQPEAYFFRIGRPDKSVFSSYCPKGKRSKTKCGHVGT